MPQDPQSIPLAHHTQDPGHPHQSNPRTLPRVAALANTSARSHRRPLWMPQEQGWGES